jgi:ABC-type amino acid transport system permease subunit
MDLRGCIIIIALCRLESLLELFPISEISKKGEERVGSVAQRSLAAMVSATPLLFFLLFLFFLLPVLPIKVP